MNCLPLRRRVRRFVRSRMPESSSRPMQALGWGSRMRLLITWLVFSLSRLSRWPSAMLRRVAERVPFRLQSFLQAGVMVRLGADFLSGVELGPIAQSRNGGQVPLPNVHANHVSLMFWRRVRRVEGVRD